MPNRTCIGCRICKAQGEFIRISDWQGEISLSDGYTNPGRGAYLCRDKACLEAAIKKKALSRAFKRGVSQAELDRLQNEFLEIVQR